MKLAAETKLEKMRNIPAGTWEDPEVQKQLRRLEAFRASFQKGILTDDLKVAQLTVGKDHESGESSQRSRGPHLD